MVVRYAESVIEASLLTSLPSTALERMLFLSSFQTIYHPALNHSINTASLPDIIYCISLNTFTMHHQTVSLSISIKLPSREMPTIKVPHFFDLPQELRDHVYCEVFSRSRCDIQALRVCRQFYCEALPFLYRQELVFPSQTSLHDWVASAGAMQASSVKAIRLSIHDIDLSPVLESVSSQPPLRPRSPELINQELEKLEHALTRLTSLCSLTVDPVQTDTPRSHQRLALCSSFLRLVARLSPRLRRLSFTSDKHSLACVQGLRNLQSLHISGCLRNSPAETLEVLFSLPQLTELEVDNTFRLYDSVGVYHGRQPGLSFTPDVLRKMRPLKSFGIYDFGWTTITPTDGSKQRLPEDQGVFVNPEMFQALYDTHLTSLEKLRISDDGSPEIQMADAFQTFLKASRIRHLETSIPAIVSSIYVDFLPWTLRSLHVEDDYPMFFVEWAQGLLDRKTRGSLPMLGEVVLWCPGHYANDAELKVG